MRAANNRTRRATTISTRSRSPRIRGDALILRLLTELAYVLLPRGVTPRTIAELARIAFVRAASDISRLRNGRVNHSRVAAQTGLTRADIKRLLDSKFSADRLVSSPLEKVIGGWRSDPEFLTDAQKPRVLRISGARGSFARLVQKHGGDVPHRAVLEELRQLVTIRESSGTVRLKASSARSIWKKKDLAFLLPVLPVVADCLRMAAELTEKHSASSIFRLTLPIQTDFDLARVRERCVSSASNMIEGLAQSLSAREQKSRFRGQPKRSYAITVVLADRQLQRMTKNLSLIHI